LRHPYVRKTAALAVGKMFDLDPTFSVEKIFDFVN